jgi:hypothetical protein
MENPAHPVFCPRGTSGGESLAPIGDRDSLRLRATALVSNCIPRLKYFPQWKDDLPPLVYSRRCTILVLV